MTPTATAIAVLACFALAAVCQHKMHRLLQRGRVTDLTTTQRLFFHVLIPALSVALGVMAAIANNPCIHP